MLAPLLFVSPGQVNFVNVSGEPFPYIGIERIGEPFVEQATAFRVEAVAAGFYTTPEGRPQGNVTTVGTDGV